MTLNNVRALVTGANGFIGSHLVERLLDEGARVAVVIRSQPGWRLTPWLDQIDVFKADILDYDTLKQTIKEIQPQKVFHLAGVTSAGMSWAAMLHAYQVNFYGTMNLIRGLAGLICDRIVLIGSAAEYGDGPVPFREEQLPRPLTAYGASKSAVTTMAMMAQRYFNLPLVVIRPTLVYGPGQSEAFFIPQLIKAAMAGRDFDMTAGEQYRDYVYISDVIEALIKASENFGAIGECINIGSGYAIKIKDIARLINRQMNEGARLHCGAIPYRQGEQWSYCADITRARAVLNWQPQVSFEEGIHLTRHWYLSKGR